MVWEQNPSAASLTLSSGQDFILQNVHFPIYIVYCISVSDQLDNFWNVLNVKILTAIC